MNPLRLFTALIVVVTLASGSLFAQAVGDYGSKASGNWGTDGTNWVVCTSPGTWTGATDPAPAAPSQTTNVWIRSGHTVTLEASTKNCLDLRVETGASLVGNITHPTGTIYYLRVYGTTATINGVFGASSSPGNNAALEAATSSSTLTITGSGTFGPSRVRVNGSASSATIVFDINTTFWYTGSSGTGGVGLYPSTDDDIFTINSGKTLTFADYSGMGVGSGNGSAAATNLTINVHGTINLSQPNSPLTLKVLSGKTATMTIFPGGSVTVGGGVYASTVADGGTTVLTANGSMTVGGPVDFTDPSFIVTGSGSFTVPASANLMLGHPAGITSAGAAGQVQTSTRTFNSGAGYSYAGTAAQVTGSGLPSTVGDLTINNASGVSLTNSVTVTDTLSLVDGRANTGANTLVMSSTGTVSRTNGHVVGTLQKNVATGSGVARLFEVGTGTSYAPVSVTFASVSTGGNLVASTTAGDHPNLVSGTIDVAKSVNRYWTVTNSGIVFTTYDATFSFVPGDIDAGAGPGLFIAEKYNGAWSGLTEGTRTSTSTQITGATAFSDFAVGQPEGAPAVPVFELSSSSLDLGNVTVGNASSDTVSIRNIGTASLSVSSIISSNTPVFTVSPASSTLSAGDSADVSITFTPSLSGSASGGIIFTHNATGSPDTLPVSGDGLPAGAIVSNGTGGGDWASAATWQGGSVPDDLDSVVILGSDSVYVLADTSCLGLLVQSGARLGLSDTLEVDDVTVNGSITVHDGGRFNVIENGTFGNGSVYNHARDGGNFPVVTWATGSTFLMTGNLSSAPASGNQSFYNVIWNAPGQTATVNLGWDSVTIGGDITVISTGIGRWQMTAPVGGDSAWVVINGDIIQSGGNFTSNGTSNANTKIVIDLYGDVNVTGGNFSVSRGSQGGGTGSTRWYLHNGDFTMSNATTQNSNPTNARFVFAKAGTQTLALGVGNTLTALPFEVSSGTTLNTGTSVVLGSGLVIVDSGATVVCGIAGGLGATLAGGGTKTFNTGSSYTFNGSAAQITSDLLPDTLHNLTISNSSGVALSDSILVNGTLTVTSGDCDLNGKIVTLGPSALLSETAGNTVAGLSGVITTTRTLASPSIANDIAGLGVMIGSAANLGSTVLTRGHAIQTANGASIRRYFDITPTTNTGLNATLKIRYDESELNGTTEPSLLLYKSTDNGTSWTLAGGTVSPGANTVEVSGLNDLSRWTVAGDFSVGVSITAGWNMISNPVTTTDDSVRQLYPNSSFSYAFSFEGGGGYQQRFVMENGRGYWEKFPGSETNPIGGEQRSSDTVAVAAGWNMLGSISQVIDTSQVEDPGGIRSSVWFGYSTGYFTATQIVPGRGYWVKASAAGSFIYSASAPAKAGMGEDPLDRMNFITITDRTGASQTLYFRAGDEIRGYDMPPLPPQGAFDARFESAAGGSMVRSHSATPGDGIEMPIAIQSSQYPLTINWKTSGNRYELFEGTHGSRSMDGEGNLVLAESVNRLVIRAGGEGIPAVFALMQNYPNPFNPTTNIRYALPVDSRVTLEICNVIGQRVRTLVNDGKAAGYHVAEWNGMNDAGRQLASGVYFVRMSANGTNGRSFNETRKLMMLK